MGSLMMRPAYIVCAHLSDVRKRPIPVLFLSRDAKYELQICDFRCDGDHVRCILATFPPKITR